MSREHFRQTALLLAFLCFAFSRTEMVAFSDDLPKPESVETSADTLKAEATKLDERIREFNLHADKYEQSPLHKRVLEHNAANVHKKIPETVTLKQEVPEYQKLSPEELADREKTINDLHAEYAMHVNQLSGLVDNYRNFFRLYANHIDQFKLEVGQLEKSNKAEKLVKEKPKLGVGSPAKSAHLYAAERDLNAVLKKMVALEDRGPTLPQSVLCPAYDDLQAEFKKALGGLTLALDEIPKDKVKLVATDEKVQIQRIQLKLVAVEQLHAQQESLQKEYLVLKESYSDISKRQRDITNELATDSKKQADLEETLDRQSAK